MNWAYNHIFSFSSDWLFVLIFDLVLISILQCYRDTNTDWWERKEIREYLPILSKDNPSLMDYIRKNKIIKVILKLFSNIIIKPWSRKWVFFSRPTWWCNTLKWTSRSDKVQNWLYFLTGCSFRSDLVQKVLTLFSRYGNFIDDVITDHWKVNFEKKALKVWESVQSIGVNINSEVHYYMKDLFLCQFLQETQRVSIEDSKILWNLKIDFGIMV